jgi:hypothetical protein
MPVKLSRHRLVQSNLRAHSELYNEHTAYERHSLNHTLLIADSSVRCSLSCPGVQSGLGFIYKIIILRHRIPMDSSVGWGVWEEDQTSLSPHQERRHFPGATTSYERTCVRRCSRTPTGYFESTFLCFSRVSINIFQDIPNYRFLQYTSHQTLYLSPYHSTHTLLINGLSR